MPRYRLTVAYDGTDFHGWAAQPGQRTVAGELARALELDPRELTVAGRTDTGVHAEANVVSLSAERLLPLRALNRRLPADLAGVEEGEAPDGFDARRDARARSYAYRLRTAPAPDPTAPAQPSWPARCSSSHRACYPSPHTCARFRSRDQEWFSHAGYQTVVVETSRRIPSFKM